MLERLILRRVRHIPWRPDESTPMKSGRAPLSFYANTFPRMFSLFESSFESIFWQPKRICKITFENSGEWPAFACVWTECLVSGSYDCRPARVPGICLLAIESCALRRVKTVDYRRLKRLLSSTYSFQLALIPFRFKCRSSKTAFIKFGYKLEALSMENLYTQYEARSHVVNSTM